MQSAVSDAMFSEPWYMNAGAYEILNTGNKDMKRLNLGKSDQFFHCSAFCRVSKSRSASKFWAATLGGIKEGRDHTLNIFGLYGSGRLSEIEMIQDNMSDLQVNQHGLSCPSTESCSDRCIQFLDPSHKKTMEKLRSEGYLE